MRRRGRLGIGKGIEFEVADVTGQEFDFFERAIVLLHGFAILRLRKLRQLRGWLRGSGSGK